MRHWAVFVSETRGWKSPSLARDDISGGTWTAGLIFWLAPQGNLWSSSTPTRYDVVLILNQLSGPEADETVPLSTRSTTVRAVVFRMGPGHGIGPGISLLVAG